MAAWNESKRELENLSEIDKREEMIIRYSGVFLYNRNTVNSISDKLRFFF